MIFSSYKRTNSRYYSHKSHVLLCMLAFFSLMNTIALFANATEVSNQKIILRYAETNGDTDERTIASKYFARLVKERTNGRIEIRVFSSGQLGITKNVIQALQLGAIDMCNEPATNLKDLGCNVGYLDIITLPFLFKDIEHAIRVMNGEFGQKLSSDINSSGFGVIALGHFVASGRNFFATIPITKLSDIKGLKIRVQPFSIYSDIVNAFGAKATPLDNSELYSALQTGVVVGAENPIKGYLNNKFYEVAKYYCWSNYLIQPSTIFISKITWNNLSNEDKEIFIECAKETTNWFQQLCKQKQQWQIQTLKSKGVVFCELEDYDLWVEAVKPIYEKYSKGCEDLIQEIQNYK